MSRMVQDQVRQWLDEAASAMSGDAGRRREALLELETSIYERLDERAEPNENDVREVLAGMGDPMELGSSMLPVQPLIPASRTRTFFFHVLVVFAVHFLVVIGATVGGTELSVPPMHVTPIATPLNVFDLLARAVGTLVFDVGMVLCGYLAYRRLGLILRFPRSVRAVRPDARRCLQGAFFLVLVLVVVDFFRDNLLALYLPNGDQTLQVPLVGPGFLANLVLFNIWIGAAIARELFYARLGERKLTLGLDVVTGATGLFCLLRIVATRELVDLSPAREALANWEAIGAVLNTAFVVIAMVTAAMLAARVVHRAYRLVLLDG